jgi:hypothetical protein
LATSYQLPAGPSGPLHPGRNPPFFCVLFFPLSFPCPVKFLSSETHVMTERSSFHRGFVDKEHSGFNWGAFSCRLARRTLLHPVNARY